MIKDRYFIHGKMPNMYVGVLTAHKLPNSYKNATDETLEIKAPSSFDSKLIGWYTLNKDVPECIFDPETIHWVLYRYKFVYDKKIEKPDFKKKFGSQFNDSCADLLRVTFVLENKKFAVMTNTFIGEGEYIKYQDDFDWIEAK